MPEESYWELAKKALLTARGIIAELGFDAKEAWKAYEKFMAGFEKDEARRRETLIMISEYMLRKGRDFCEEVADIVHDTAVALELKEMLGYIPPAFDVNKGLYERLRKMTEPIKEKAERMCRARQTRPHEP